MDFYSVIERILFDLNWNRRSSEYLFQVFLFLKSLERNVCGLKKSFSISKTSQKTITVPTRMATCFKVALVIMIQQLKGRDDPLPVPS